MDSVFISTKKSPKKGIFKNFIGSNSKRRNSYQSQASDAATEYFPFAGGDGVDSYEFQPDHMSYEPAESMLDTDITLEVDPSVRLRRNVKKVFLRNSGYAVYDRSRDLTEPTEKPSPMIESNVPEEPEPLPLTAAAEQSLGDYDIHEFWTLQWLNNLPTSFDMAIPHIRKAARSTFILAPLDALADHVEGSEILVAGLEVFSMMLIADLAAKIVRVICFPAVSIFLFILKLF